MKKGFTLVEVIGVLILIGAIALISIPVVEKQVKDGKQKMYDSQISYIKLAAENWLSDNSLFVPDNDEVITILLSQLKRGEYIATDIKDPLTQELFPNDMQIEISKVDGILEFNVLTDTGTNYDEYDINTPNIALRGSIVTNVELGGRYIEPGAVATTRTGTNLAVTTSGTVNTSVIGSYNITYSVNDNGHTNSMIRTVFVKDTKSPEVSITGGDIDVYDNQIAMLNLNDDITASDNSGEYSIEIESGLSTIPGKYTITYIVSDESGNTTTKFRSINVLRSGNPIFSLGQTNIEVDLGQNFDLTSGVKASDPNGYALGYTCRIGANDCTTSGLSLGTYTVTYTATFNSNTTTVTKTLNVIRPCSYAVNHQFNFDYTGATQNMTVPCTGNYKLEVWGAQGNYRSSADKGGLGGYSSGELLLDETTNLFIYTGGQGSNGTCTGSICTGGFNGGGYRYSYKGGGGASDIRIGTDSLYARVIVAGGGGSDGATAQAGGYAGGSEGTRGSFGKGTYGYGGNQVGTYASGLTPLTTQGTTNTEANSAAGFGFGGFGGYRGGLLLGYGYGGGGGGGWYGGEGVYPDASVDDDGGGGGGSGYIYTASTAINYPSGCLLNSNHYLTETSLLAGDVAFTSPTGTSETGHAGNGYVRITYLGK